MRELKSAAYIRDVIQLAIDSSPAIPIDERPRAPTPVPLGHEDADGCNWTIDDYDGPEEYALVVAAAVRLAMMRFNLR